MGHPQVGSEAANKFEHSQKRQKHSKKILEYVKYNEEEIEASAKAVKRLFNKLSQRKV